MASTETLGNFARGARWALEWFLRTGLLPGWDASISRDRFEEALRVLAPDRCTGARVVYRLTTSIFESGRPPAGVEVYDEIVLSSARLEEVMARTLERLVDTSGRHSRDVRILKAEEVGRVTMEV